MGGLDLDIWVAKVVNVVECVVNGWWWGLDNDVDWKVHLELGAHRN